MLYELRIENFAIIEKLQLFLDNGLLTFTGETGAGKSIILDALTAVIGGKVETSMIRSGANTALIEAVFKMPEQIRPVINSLLEQEELQGDEESILMLSREIRDSGRSVARVNGRSVNVGTLREIGENLIDIHGQTEHLSLLKESRHLQLLDRYAGHESLLKQYGNLYRELQKTRKALNDLRLDEQQTAHQMDLLNFQIDEIETAHLKEGEDEDLKQERDRLANAEKLATLCQQNITLLDEGEADGSTILEQIGIVVDNFEDLARMDSTMSEMAEQAAAAAETLNDISLELRSYQDEIEFNPKRLEQVEDRLDLINNLKRKYGESIENILGFAEKAREKLESFTNAEENIEKLEKQEAVLLKDLSKYAEDLSASRKVFAEKLAKGVEAELQDLNMIQARFKVGFEYVPDDNGLQIDAESLQFNQYGVDKIAFLIAPNPGEGFNPLVKTASGGETSRLMLALKNVLAKADYVPTLIFDEIDQGIGGRIGAVVGEKLWQLGLDHQVLCVTHLPQLAAFGNQQFKVGKHIEEGRTTTRVELLDQEAREAELAEMFGHTNETGMQSAREALALARRRMQELISQ